MFVAQAFGELRSDQNRIAFGTQAGNIMWDVTQNFQVGFEVSHWDTDYAPQAPLILNQVFRDNQSTVYHFASPIQLLVRRSDRCGFSAERKVLNRLPNSDVSHNSAIIVEGVSN